MTAVPEPLCTSSGQGLRAAMAIMYAPNPVPVRVKKPMKISDLKTKYTLYSHKTFSYSI